MIIPRVSLEEIIYCLLKENIAVIFIKNQRPWLFWFDNSINDDDPGKLLPGIGTGFRYTIVKQYPMNAGFDIAAGKDD